MKTVIKLTLLILSVIQCQATSLYFTNSTVGLVRIYGINDGEGMGRFEIGEISPSSFLTAESSAFNDLGQDNLFAWALEGDGFDEGFIREFPSSDGTFGIIILGPDDVTEWGEFTVVPEPSTSALTIFFAGFGLCFTGGLTSWAARFTRTLVTGGNNE